MKLLYALLFCFTLIGAPTPFVQQTNQPNCLVSTLAMFSAERLDKTNYTIGYWSNRLDKVYGAKQTGEITVEMGIDEWNKVFRTNQLTVVYAAKDQDHLIYYRRPYVWVGEFGHNQYHACLVYFQMHHVILKHILIDPQTGTNYMNKWDYETFFKKTIGVYGVK